MGARFCRSCFDGACPKCGQESCRETDGSCSHWNLKWAKGPDSSVGSVNHRNEPVAAVFPDATPNLYTASCTATKPGRILVLFDLTHTLMLRTSEAIEGAVCPSTDFSQSGWHRHMYHRHGCADILQFVRQRFNEHWGFYTDIDRAYALDVIRSLMGRELDVQVQETERSWVLAEVGAP